MARNNNAHLIMTSPNPKISMPLLSTMVSHAHLSTEHDMSSSLDKSQTNDELDAVVKKKNEKKRKAKNQHRYYRR